MVGLSVWINELRHRAVQFEAEATSGQVRKMGEAIIPPGNLDREARARFDYMTRNAHVSRHIQRPRSRSRFTSTTA